MEGFSLQAIRRLPLAEAVMLLFRSMTDDVLLSSIWDKHRGRRYDRVISFPVVVPLMSNDRVLRGRTHHASIATSAGDSAEELLEGFLESFPDSVRIQFDSYKPPTHSHVSSSPAIRSASKTKKYQPRIQGQSSRQKTQPHKTLTAVVS